MRASETKLDQKRENTWQPLCLPPGINHPSARNQTGWMYSLGSEHCLECGRDNRHIPRRVHSTGYRSILYVLNEWPSELPVVQPNLTFSNLKSQVVPVWMWLGESVFLVLFNCIELVSKKNNYLFWWHLVLVFFMNSVNLLRCYQYCQFNSTFYCHKNELY